MRRLFKSLVDEYPVKYKKGNTYSRMDSLKDSGYLALFFVAGFIGGVGIVGAFCYLVYTLKK